MTEISHIFISYKSEERHFAIAVRDHLRGLGYHTWLDVDNLPPKSEWEDEFDWQHEIDAALKSAFAVVAVITPAAASSRYVTAEWDIAIARAKLLIPLIHQPTELPWKYKNLKLVNVTDAEKAFAALQQTMTRPSNIADPFYEYLNDFFERVSSLLGQLMIKTLSTYGAEGRVAGEPIHLQVELDNGKSIDDIDLAFSHCNYRAVLLSEPGGGKTITLLNYARDAIVKRILDPAEPLPIWADINSWDSQAQTPFKDWILNREGMPTEVASVIERGNALFLLDGLDELWKEREDTETKVRFDPRPRFLAQIPADNRVLITCRTDDFAELIQYSPIRQTFTLRLLNDEQMLVYLRDQQAVRQAVDTDLTLRNMLRTPLLLSFFAFAYEGMSSEERQVFYALTDTSAMRDKLIEQYVKRRYQHEENRGQIPVALVEMRRIIGQMALMMVAWKFNILSYDNVGKVLDFDKEQTEEFFELGIRLHLFVRQNPSQLASQNSPAAKNLSVDFAHLLLRDHFVSAYCLPTLTEPSLEKSSDRAMNALANIGDRRAFQTMMDILADLEVDANIRAAAANALPDYNDSAAINSLTQALSDPDVRVRYRAVNALGYLGAVQSIGPMSQLLNDYEEVIGVLMFSQGPLSHTVARQLEKFGTPDALAALEQWKLSEVERLSLALSDTDVEVRSDAILDLAKWNDSRTVSLLIQCLSDKSEDAWGMFVCNRAIEALGQLKDPRAVNALIPLLSDTSRDRWQRVCDQAANALTTIDTPEARVALRLWKAQQANNTQQ